MTGATRGLGYFACEQLARAGAHVTLTGRNPNRLADARAAVNRRVPDADVESLLLDTSNLGSVRAAAATVKARGKLHGLLLNAGIVHAPKERTTTPDGHELVFATNVLGHFALAGALLGSLAAGLGRMVWVGSLSTSLPGFEVDPVLENDYSPWRAYVQSKIATTALGLDADRRLRASHTPVASVIAHPGYSIGGRTPGILGVNEPTRVKRFFDNLQAPIAQSKEDGAWSLVHALVAPEVESGQLWGPRMLVRGAPTQQKPRGLAHEPEVAERLWEYCQEATGIRWPRTE